MRKRSHWVLAGLCVLVVVMGTQAQAQEFKGKIGKTLAKKLKK